MQLSMNALQRRVGLVLIQVRSTVTVQEPAAAMFIIIRISILRSEKSETHTQLYNDAIKLYTVMCIIKYYIRLYIIFVREQCTAVLYLWDIFIYSPRDKPLYMHHLLFKETFFYRLCRHSLSPAIEKLNDHH